MTTPSSHPSLATLTSTEMGVLQDALYAYRSDSFDHSQGRFHRARPHLIGGALRFPYTHNWEVRLSAGRRDRWLRLGLLEKIPLCMASVYPYRFSVAAMAVALPVNCPSKSIFESASSHIIRLHQQLVSLERS